MPGTINLDHLADASFNEQVVTLRELFGFTQEEFGEVLGGLSAKTIQRWEQDGEPNPRTQNKQAVVALRTIAEALGDLFEPDVIKVWVDRPNKALGGERPRDFAKKPGHIYVMANLLGTLGR